jgi:hypothetical protein
MVARRELPGSLRETIRPVGYGERKCRCQHRSERRGETRGILCSYLTVAVELSLALCFD